MNGPLTVISDSLTEIITSTAENPKLVPKTFFFYFKRNLFVQRLYYLINVRGGINAKKGSESECFI